MTSRTKYSVFGAVVAIVVLGAIVNAGITGFDIYGRDNLSVLVRSMAMSLAHGALFTATAFLIPLFGVAAVAVTGSTYVERTLRFLAMALESVPIYFWVLIILLSFRGYTLLHMALAFSIATFPIIYTIFQDEYYRLQSTDYTLAAYALGARRIHVFWRHILPNMQPVTAPLFLNIFGASLAVKGAVSILGFGNRQIFDLGVMLFRGLEQVGENITLILLGTAAYTLIYIALVLLTTGRHSLHAKSGARLQQSPLKRRNLKAH